LNREREFGVLTESGEELEGPPIRRSKMRKLRVTCAALLVLAAPAFHDAQGARPPAAQGPIATIADRRIDEADVRRAALVLADDPLRIKKPALWRKKLLDLCIDRELLALEAERAGLLKEPAIRHEIERRNAAFLYPVIRDRILVPEIQPTAAQMDSARAGGLYRRVRMSYIQTLTDHQKTIEVFAALQKGARFDSIASTYSIHPSSTQGADFGWKWAGELNRASRDALKTAKPGDILGPYPNSGSYEIYRIEAIREPEDTELREKLLRDRAAGMEGRYADALLKGFKFELNPTTANSVVFATATERVDSILASLGPDGTRQERGVRPALGILARVDGDSITYSDIAYSETLRPDGAGKVRIESTAKLRILCATAILPRLIARDAHEYGVDRDPAVARTLRLIREEVSTRAMVARAVPEPSDPGAVRAYFESHAARYQRPPARRALVAMFNSEDSARAALRSWNGIGFRDSTLIANGFREQPRASAATLLGNLYAEMPLFDTERDPLSLAARSLDAGQMAPVVHTPHGYALALVLGREAARPMTFSEAAVDAAVDAREAREEAWVTDQLNRLRAATPARTVPARLEAVRLDLSSKAGGKRR